MAWLNLLYKFLRLGPLGLGVIALAVLALGFYLQIGEYTRDVQRAAALAAGAPAAVDIVKFDRDRDMTDLREVVVRAQPIMDVAYRLTLTKDSGNDHVFMIPLVSEHSNSETAIVGIAYFDSRTDDFDNITPELLMTGMVGFGGVAPLIEYNGRLGSMGQWDDLTEESFFDEGLTLPQNPVVVWPYPEGSAVALAPRGADDMTIFGLLSKIAGAIGLLALAKLVFSSKPDTDTSADLGSAIAASDSDHIVPRQASAVPLWKQRSGLVSPEDMNAQDPLFNASAFDSASVQDAERVKPRAGFGLRQVMVGLVGGLFVLGLVSTVSGLVKKSAPAEIAGAQIQPIEQVVAAGVADAIVPDADPRRHWTDIDVTPIAEWFTAKFLLAVAGDVEAQLTLGAIIGAVFVGLFMLRFFFVLRRAFQPKTTARFDSMGIN